MQKICVLCSHNRTLCPVHHEFAYLKRRLKTLLRCSLKYLHVQRKHPWVYYLGASWHTVIQFLLNKMKLWNQMHTARDTARMLTTANMQLDHIKPKKSFLNAAYSAREILCNHYTNLQPLLPEDNIYKGSQWSWPDDIYWQTNIIMQRSHASYFPRNLQAPSSM